MLCINGFSLRPLPTSCSAGEKVSWRILGHALRHHIPCGYVRVNCVHLSDVVRPLTMERDQHRNDDYLRPYHQTAGPGYPVVHLPGSARPVESPFGVLRPRHQTQALLVPPAQSWVARGRVPHQTSQSPSREKPTPARERLHKPSVGGSVPVLPSTIGHSEGS